MRIYGAPEVLAVLGAITLFACSSTPPPASVRTPLPAPRESATSPSATQPIVRQGEAAFSAFAIEASRAVIAGSLGQEMDARWLGDEDEDLRAMREEDRVAVAALGSPVELALAVVELQGRTPSHRIKLFAVVLPDGAVRWGEVNVRPLHDDEGEPGDIGAAVPAVQGLLDATVTHMRAPGCPLPWIAAAEVATLPESLRRRIVPPSPAEARAAVAPSCEAVRADPASFRLSVVEDFAVIVRGASGYLVLESGMEVHEGRVWLERARADEL